ncbi:MAG: enoyl-CoA hydratase [Alphaproteobacteria bacterium]|nr:MAG: enoyl-CoA hydratase [Alphaproteobacteria bacterium]
MANFITTELEEKPQGIVARVTLRNEKKLNTMNSAIIAEMDETLQHLDDNPDVAVVVLTGAGEKAFVGGANIEEMSKLTPDTARSFITALHHICHKARHLQVPVIARINGYCLGAGMELAGACDIVVAEPSARFGMPEVRVGIPSVIDAALLPHILGANLARDLVMTGRLLTGEEAYTAGFVQRLAKEGGLDVATDQVIEEILEGGRNAMRLQKKLCNEWEHNTLREGIQIGIDTFAESYESDEPAVMMGHFLNRGR